MEKLLRAYNVFGIIKKIGMFISCLAVIFMMFFIFYDVLSRNLFATSIRGGFEIIQNYLMPLVVFPGLAYVYASGVVPKMDLIIEKFNRKLKKGVIFVLLLLEFFILILLFIYTWEYALDGLAREVSFPAGGALYPVYPFFFTVPIAFLLIIIENVFIFFRNILMEDPSLLVVDSSEEDVV